MPVSCAEIPEAPETCGHCAAAFLIHCRCVLTPADPYMPLSNDEIVGRVNEQVMSLFPSSLFPSGLLVGRVKGQVMNLFLLAEGLELIWSHLVKDQRPRSTLVKRSMTRIDFGQRSTTKI